MRRIFCTLALSAAVLLCFAQSKPKVRLQFSNNESNRHTSLLVECDDMQFCLDAGGRLSINLDDLSGECRVEYYGPGYGDWREGKLKSINGIAVDYYAPGYGSWCEGKLKSVGKTAIEYYAPGYGDWREGKVKSIGESAVDYFSPGYGSWREGKISSVGNVKLEYYGPGDGSYRDGQVRSIGHS